jgi:hypothetical protein
MDANINGTNINFEEDTIVVSIEDLFVKMTSNWAKKPAPKRPPKRGRPGRSSGKSSPSKSSTQKQKATDNNIIQIKLSDETKGNYN